MTHSGLIIFICKFSVSLDLPLIYPKVKIAIACLSGEGEKRGGLREQALMRREDLSNTREEERRRGGPRKEEGGMMVRRESSPRREGGARRESSPRKEDPVGIPVGIPVGNSVGIPVGRRENSSRHSSLVSRTSQVLLAKESSQTHTYFH